MVLLFVYAVSGLLSGLGGVMSASRLYAANGLQLGQSYELDAIAAVILGGTSFVGGVGSIAGTLVGALIIAVLSNGLILLGVSDIWQYIIKGLVIIARSRSTAIARRALPVPEMRPHRRQTVIQPILKALAAGVLAALCALPALAQTPAPATPASAPRLRNDR